MLDFSKIFEFWVPLGLAYHLPFSRNFDSILSFSKFSVISIWISRLALNFLTCFPSTIKFSSPLGFFSVAKRSLVFGASFSATIWSLHCFRKNASVRVLQFCDWTLGESESSNCFGRGREHFRENGKCCFLGIFHKLYRVALTCNLRQCHNEPLICGFFTSEVHIETCKSIKVAM